MITQIGKSLKYPFQVLRRYTFSLVLKLWLLQRPLYYLDVSIQVIFRAVTSPGRHRSNIFRIFQNCLISTKTMEGYTKLQSASASSTPILKWKFLLACSIINILVLPISVVRMVNVLSFGILFFNEAFKFIFYFNLIFQLYVNCVLIILYQGDS